MLPKKIREQVIKRARGYCEYCKCPAQYSTMSFCFDHIIPNTKPLSK